MARCIECGASGFFLRVNENGLCPDCAKHDTEIRLSIAENGQNRNENALPALQNALQELISSAESVPGLDVDSVKTALAAFKRAVDADTKLCSMLKTASSSALQEQNQIAENLLSEATILINELSKKLKPAPSVESQAYTPADEILKYKNLLDIGAITKEEYDAKKQQLLTQ